MATEKYSQCLLRRGNAVDVAWIEDVFAITDRPLKIKVNGRWQSGWYVDTVYATENAYFVEAHHRDYTRMATYQE